MLWLFDIFDLFLSPWIRIRIPIQRTPESGSNLDPKHRICLEGSNFLKKGLAPILN